MEPPPIPCDVCGESYPVKNMVSKILCPSCIGILAEAIAKSEGKFRKAYLVLGGNGWTLRDFYLGDGLKQYLRNCDSVEVAKLENFVAKANQGRL